MQWFCGRWQTRFQNQSANTEEYGYNNYSVVSEELYGSKNGDRYNFSIDKELSLAETEMEINNKIKKFESEIER